MTNLASSNNVWMYSRKVASKQVSWQAYPRLGGAFPPKLLKTLMTTTIHAAVDYSAVAWLPTEPPRFFVDQLAAIDNTCARSALGALKTTPTVFLRHNLYMTPPATRLQGKVLGFMARSLAKPTTHPFFKLIQQAQSSTPRSHRNLFHSFFLHPLHNKFKEFITQLPVDPASTLTRPGNLSTIIQLNKNVAKSNAAQLKPSTQHLLIFSDGSRIPGKSMAEAAWCTNNRTSRSEHLGPASAHGIYQAEYRGVQLGLAMALEKATVSQDIY